MPVSLGVLCWWQPSSFCWCLGSQPLPAPLSLSSVAGKISAWEVLGSAAVLWGSGLTCLHLSHWEKVRLV